MVTLCDLPNDILFKILTQHDFSERDLYAFCKVNHRLHAIAKRCLYRKNASQHGSSALLWASKTGNLSTALYALEHGGADVNTSIRRGHRETALMVAARRGHEKIAELLIETPTCNIDAENSDGKRALAYAAEGGCEAIVQLLIDKGTDVNHQNQWGTTALTMAARFGHAAIARL
jgi:ankyrin repeat protein